MNARYVIINTVEKHCAHRSDTPLVPHPVVGSICSECLRTADAIYDALARETASELGPSTWGTTPRSDMLDAAAALDVIIMSGCDQSKNVAKVRDFLRRQADAR